jgi:hypothetical protein
MKSGSNQAGDVRDVRHHFCLHAAGDLPDALEIDRSRIRRRAADQKLRSMFLGKPLQFVVIDLLRVLGDAVVRDFVIDPRKIEGMPVSQMSAVRKVHP